MKRRQRAFSLMEALIGLVMIGMVLALVAQSFGRLVRLNQFSSRGAFKSELHSSLLLFCSELSAALSMSSAPNQLTITRVDPTLNLTYVESRERLPWPLPNPLPTDHQDPNRPPFVLTVRYSLKSDRLVCDDGRILISGLASWNAHRVNPADPWLWEVQWISTDKITLQANVYLPMVKP